MDLWIEGGTVVFTDRVEPANLHISGGRIAGIYKSGDLPVCLPPRCVHHINAHGLVVMPGIIDTHCDAIERELEPRPGTLIPFRLAFYAMERRLVACGITTVYHSLSLSGGEGVRSNETVDQLVTNIRQVADEEAMIRHRVHLRYEVTNLPGLEIVQRHVEAGTIDLLSYMDHSPNQGQFKKHGQFERYVLKTYGLHGEAAQAMKERFIRLQREVDWSRLKEIAREGVRRGILLASHDDDERERIDFMADCGAVISEFPIHLRAAAYALDRGMYVSMGAPNIVRGVSHNCNLRARDAITASVCHLLCSDYYPPAMLEAVFRLARDGFKLHEAVRLVTLGPAKALGIEQEFGSIEVGKRADLIVVELVGSENGLFAMDEFHVGAVTHSQTGLQFAWGLCPVVRHTVLNGVIVYQADSIRNDAMGGRL